MSFLLFLFVLGDILDAFAQLNISTTACHVGSDGDRALLTGLCNDIRFTGVVLGI